MHTFPSNNTRTTCLLTKRYNLLSSILRQGYKTKISVNCVHLTTDVPMYQQRAERPKAKKNLILSLSKIVCLVVKRKTKQITSWWLNVQKQSRLPIISLNINFYILVFPPTHICKQKPYLLGMSIHSKLSYPFYILPGS